MHTVKTQYKKQKTRAYHFKHMIVRLIMLFLVTITLTTKAKAQNVSPDGVKASINTLSFVRGLSGSNNKGLSIAILYDPSASGSEDEARQVKIIIDSVKPEYSSVLVKASELETAKSVDVFYIVRNLSSFYPSIKSFYLENHIFSIGADEQCIRNDCCLISIRQSGSTIDVLMNSDALSKAGFDVDTVLRYMAVSL